MATDPENEPKKKRWGWGGWRPGAGRKPKGEKAGVPHRERPRLSTRFPVHVLLRLDQELALLSSPEARAALEQSFEGGRDRFGFRLNEYAVKDHEIHLIVEAVDTEALSRGVKGLSIRISRSVNPVLRRKGRLWADRWEATILRTPEEVARVRTLIAGASGGAPLPGLSSAAPDAPVEPPRTRLLADAQRDQDKT